MEMVNRHLNAENESFINYFDERKKFSTDKIVGKAINKVILQK